MPKFLTIYSKFYINQLLPDYESKILQYKQSNFLLLDEAECNEKASDLIITQEENTDNRKCSDINFITEIYKKSNSLYKVNVIFKNLNFRDQQEPGLNFNDFIVLLSNLIENKKAHSFKLENCCLSLQQYVELFILLNKVSLKKIYLKNNNLSYNNDEISSYFKYAEVDLLHEKERDVKYDDYIKFLDIKNLIAKNISFISNMPPDFNYRVCDTRFDLEKAMSDIRKSKARKSKSFGDVEEQLVSNHELTSSNSKSSDTETFIDYSLSTTDNKRQKYRDSNDNISFSSAPAIIKDNTQRPILGDIPRTSSGNSLIRKSSQALINGCKTVKNGIVNIVKHTSSSSPRSEERANNHQKPSSFTNLRRQTHIGAIPAHSLPENIPHQPRVSHLDSISHKHKKSSSRSKDRIADIKSEAHLSSSM